MISLKRIVLELWDHNLLEMGEATTPTIYCDMDGVLVDFIKGFKAISGGVTPSEYEKTNNIWKLIHSQPNGGIDWWAKLPKISDADKLWGFISSLGLQVKILSSTSAKASNSNVADIGKRMWLNTNLSPIPVDENIILVDSATMKQTYAKSINDILIDDYSKNISSWVAKGGRGVRHISVDQTINELRAIFDNKDQRTP